MRFSSDVASLQARMEHWDQDLRKRVPVRLCGRVFLVTAGKGKFGKKMGRPDAATPERPPDASQSGVDSRVLFVAN
jgi:hypothetical protein